MKKLLTVLGLIGVGLFGAATLRENKNADLEAKRKAFFATHPDASMKDFADWQYDFSGWATRNNLKCSDGRTIRRGAFKDNHGKTVPLVWNHQHNDSFNVLGHALLENREEGVYAYCTFNETEAGQNAKLIVEHGDVTALSIYANQLQQKGGDVLHGAIREVSLVLAGANPGALIDSIMAHGEASDEEAIIYTGEPIDLSHSSEPDKEDPEKKDDPPKDKPDEKKDKKEDEETVADVFDTFTEKQKTVVYALIGQALESADESDDNNKSDEKKEDKDMKHNVFDKDDQDRVSGGVISHADQMDIINTAKNVSVGSFQNALDMYMEDNQLQHADVSGFVQEGDGNVTALFPEYKDVRPGAPELITNDQGWVDVVMRKVHKSPISRIRTRQVDIRNLQSLRAKGYQKGKKKTIAGNIKLATRTTDPQTVFVKDALHRDDIVDITDFDYVQYLYNIDRMMLNEELATAIMLGETFTGSISNVKAALSRIGAEFISPLIVQNGPLVEFFNALRVKINDVKSEIGPLATLFTDSVSNMAKSTTEFLNGLDIKSVMQGFNNLLDGLLSFLRPIRDAFRDVFPKKSIENVNDGISKFKDLTSNFKLSADGAKSLQCSLWWMQILTASRLPSMLRDPRSMRSSRNSQTGVSNLSISLRISTTVPQIRFLIATGILSDQESDTKRFKVPITLSLIFMRVWRDR